MTQGNPFIDNVMYKFDSNGNISDLNTVGFDRSDEAFELFKKLYDTDYGSINQDENLISIHTGGWSENESLISDFKNTVWWFKHHEITSRGGHYYFNTHTSLEKEWQIISK